MWEAIRANKRRSAVLILMMAGILIALGYGIGLYFAPDYAFVGVLAAVVIWLFLWMMAVIGGRGMLLGSVQARRIQHDDAPVLFNVVEEMTIAAGLPKMPQAYIIDTDAPNAFAVGNEQNSAVAVTAGLLMQLSRDELQGVVAHEIGHIKNHDTRFMVLAGVMMGAIILLADAFVRGVFYSGGRGRRRSSGKGGGQAQIVVLILALVLAVLAPLLAQLLYFACSRRREYLADASAARFTRYPAGLASALEKISASAQKMAKVNRAVAPMFTVSPLKGGAAHSLFSTHPPTEDRVRVLRSMGGAGYAEYEAAFAGAQGGHLIGDRTLADAEPVGLRAPSPEPEKTGLAKARDAVDILHRMGGYLFLTCACGLKVKVPPGYKKDEVHCPRCGRVTPIPRAVMAAAGTAAAAELAGRQMGEWQSFRCPCGWTVNLSPGHSARQMVCPGCGRTIRTDPT